MRSTFKLFNSHLDLSHHYWSQIVTPNGIVIDATCGNGHDTLFLAKISSGKIIAYDIQETAILSTKNLLGDNNIDLSRVQFVQGSHSEFHQVQDNSVDLIVYNLGYLPGSNKQVKTQPETTLKSIQNGMELIKNGGAISVTFYPGHPEGLEEQKMILAWASQIDPQQWSCCHHQWMNRRESPTLLLMQKAKK